MPRSHMSDADIFGRLRDVIARGWLDIPRKYGGTGAPGMYLEFLLGLEANNSDTPDTGKWELKYHSEKGTGRMTLFQLEATPKGYLEFMVHKFGILRDDGIKSFRHTIHSQNSNKGLVVTDFNGSIVVSHPNHPEVNEHKWPRWEHDDIINAFVSKFRRLITVSGRTRSADNGRQVKYLTGHAHEDLRSTKLISMIVDGTIAIEFNARTKLQKTSLRNHGTRFRIPVKDLGKLYSKCRSIT